MKNKWKICYTLGSIFAKYGKVKESYRGVLTYCIK